MRRASEFARNLGQDGVRLLAALLPAAASVAERGGKQTKLRPDDGGRPGNRRPGLLRQQDSEDPQRGPAGPGGREADSAHRRRQPVHAQPGGVPHRTLPGPIRDGHPQQAGGLHLRRVVRRPPSGGGHLRHDRPAARLRDGADREVAPGAELREQRGSLSPPRRPRLRLLLRRPADQPEGLPAGTRHRLPAPQVPALEGGGGGGAALRGGAPPQRGAQRAADGHPAARRLLPARRRVGIHRRGPEPELRADEGSRDRGAAVLLREPDAEDDPGSRGLHREELGATFPPLRLLHPSAHGPLRLGGVPGDEPPRPVRRRRPGGGLECGSDRGHAGPPGSGGKHAGLPDVRSGRSPGGGAARLQRGLPRSSPHTLRREAAPHRRNRLKCLCCLGVAAGGKSMSWEGGIRVPGILRWPGRIPGGREVDEVTSNMDLFPTVVRLSGAEPPADRHIDGHDLTDLLEGGAETSGHEFLFHYCNAFLNAVRWKPRNSSSVWKAFFFTPDFSPPDGVGCFHTHVCFCTPDAVTVHDPPLLFDLSRDPSESTPLTPDTEPAFHSVLAAMRQAVDTHQSGLTPVESQLTPARLMWKPWLQPCCSSPAELCRC